MTKDIQSSPRSPPIQDDLDAELIQATLQGNPHSFGELIKKHQPHLFLMVQKHLRQREEAEDVVQQVPSGETVLVAPVLHQFQLDDLLRQSPILQRHRVILQPYDGQQVAGQYLLLFRRRADLPDELRTGPVSAELLAETRHGTTQLAALYRFTPKVVP